MKCQRKLIESTNSWCNKSLGKTQEKRVRVNLLAQIYMLYVQGGEQYNGVIQYGYAAMVAIPHWLFLFLDIRM